MADPDCIFCKIVAGELPATIVDEDERTIAFMDIAPATRGHALVIPRAHSVDLLSVDPKISAQSRSLRSGSLGGSRSASARMASTSELVRTRRLADGLPLPRARDPALRGRPAAAAVGARRGRSAQIAAAAQELART